MRGFGVLGFGAQSNSICAAMTEFSVPSYSFSRARQSKQTPAWIPREW